MGLSVPVGFVAPSTPGDVRRLEAAGAASLWVGGHIASPNPAPEPMAWLARLVEQSRSAILGTATLLLPLYPPALVAKQIADLDRASGGRLVLGVGVGGEYASDFEAAGVPMPERGARADEAIPLLRSFWASASAASTRRTSRRPGFPCLSEARAPMRPSRSCARSGAHSRCVITARTSTSTAFASTPGRRSRAVRRSS